MLPDQSRELLAELHLVKRDGRLHADSLRKLKQVNHLLRLLAPAFEDVATRHPDPVWVDFASGNSYLGFVAYELFFKPRETGQVMSVEVREDLSQRAIERARRLEYARMSFACGEVAEVSYPPRVHIATALHACDTATDDALARGIALEADYIAVVPCCQAEVAALLKQTPEAGEGILRELYSHPWHRREFASHLTNVIRALVLEAHGYQVTVTELVGWEHSLKNELIVGRRVHRESSAARARLNNLVHATGVKPHLVRLLA